jgi:hypothetical protein
MMPLMPLVHHQVRPELAEIQRPQLPIILGLVSLPAMHDLIPLDGICHQGVTIVGPNRTVRIHLGGVD